MRKLATFSFDDGGWQDATVMELFKSMGLQCTFYLPSRLLLEHVYDGSHVDGIRDMYSGWEVGSHTRTHRRLSRLPYPELMEEVSGSRNDLHDFFQRNIRLLCYPYGDHNKEVMMAGWNAGYKWARSIKRDAPNMFAQPAHAMSQPITGILDEGGRCDNCFDATLAEGRPVHVIGHSWAVMKHGKHEAIKNYIKRLWEAGYTIVHNSVFYEETNP